MAAAAGAAGSRHAGGGQHRATSAGGVAVAAVPAGAATRERARAGATGGRQRDERWSGAGRFGRCGEHARARSVRVGRRQTRHRRAAGASRRRRLRAVRAGSGRPGPTACAHRAHERRRAATGGRLAAGAAASRRNGADERSRTSDLLITNQLLYQLSYISADAAVARNEGPGRGLRAANRDESTAVRPRPWCRTTCRRAVARRAARPARPPGGPQRADHSNLRPGCPSARGRRS